MATENKSSLKLKLKTEFIKKKKKSFFFLFSGEQKWDLNEQLTTNSNEPSKGAIKDLKKIFKDSSKRMEKENEKECGCGKI